MTRRRRTGLVAAGAAAIVVAANASEGAYFSQSWGWVALAFLAPVTLALILGAVEAPGALRIAFVVLVVALGAWIALSAAWSLSSAASIREAERMLAYVAVALALAFLLRRGDAPGLAGGIFAGIVVIAGYGLATRLFPDRFDAYDDPVLPYRLSEPIGYWNSFGLLVAMGILVGLGLAAHARRLAYRVGAGLALPLLATAMYFAFSRGAWVALVAGYAAAVALDPRRLRLLWTTLAVALAPVLAVALASRQEALTTEDAPVADAVAQGERLALWLLVLAILSGALVAVAGVAARQLVPPPRARRVADVALASIVVVAVSWVVIQRGGPTEALTELKDRFDSPAVGVDPTDLNSRLFTLSGSGRLEQIDVAWDAARERIVQGNGAGTYEYFWYSDRRASYVIRDAHSLYVEMLAEAGIVGLVLLSLALLVPLVAVLRGRRERLVGAAAGAYVAWLGHSALDWNWEVVGVTTSALLAGGVGLLAADRRARVRLADTSRMTVVAFSVVLSAAAVISLVGNQALFAGREALQRENWAKAADDARLAERLLPWSFEPAVVLGDASAGLGDREATLDAYRDAVATDPRNWVVWLRLAQVAEGDERRRAYARVRELNPGEGELPGERRTG